MKNCIVVIAILTMHTNNGMMRNVGSRTKPMTPLLMRHLRTFIPPTWPHYTREQADLITSQTLKHNHLHKTDAYDRNLKRKIEAAAAMVCPGHRPAYGTRIECSTCCKPQEKAFYLVSEAINKKSVT